MGSITLAKVPHFWSNSSTAVITLHDDVRPASTNLHDLSLSPTNHLLSSSSRLPPATTPTATSFLDTYSSVAPELSISTQTSGSNSGLTGSAHFLSSGATVDSSFELTNSEASPPRPAPTLTSSQISILSTISPTSSVLTEKETSANSITSVSSTTTATKAQSSSPVSALHGVHHDTESVLSRVDPADLAYALLYLLWTIILLPGLYTIYAKRRAKAIQVRNWRLIFLAIAAIHVFTLTCFTAYWARNYFTCSCDFWLVSLVHPCCVAAFQFSNIRLASYHDANLRSSGIVRGRSGSSQGSWWQRATIARKANSLLAIALCIQVAGTTFLYLGSRSFHRSYGLWGHQPHQPQMCMRSPEWVVSVSFQIIWAFGIGLLVLRRTWKIRDVYFYGVETKVAICCSVLPVPLWIVFTFVKTPTIASVDERAIPMMWFIPGFALLQLILVYLPFWVVRCNEQRDTYANRESYSGDGTEMMLRFIRDRADLLIRYAAKTRFNAELVIFLCEVQSWKAMWNSTMAAKHNNCPPSIEHVQCYKHAALIYFKLVDLEHAAFPINISGGTRKSLHATFRHAIFSTGHRQHLRSDPATPWDVSDFPSCKPEQHVATDIGISLSEALSHVGLRSRQIDTKPRLSVGDLIEKYLPPIQEQVSKGICAMDLEVFDDAVAEVKHEAYHNIWLPFTNSGEHEHVTRRVDRP